MSDSKQASPVVEVASANNFAEALYEAELGLELRDNSAALANLKQILDESVAGLIEFEGQPIDTPALVEMCEDWKNEAKLNLCKMKSASDRYEVELSCEFSRYGRIFVSLPTLIHPRAIDLDVVREAEVGMADAVRQLRLVGRPEEFVTNIYLRSILARVLRRTLEEHENMTRHEFVERYAKLCQEEAETHNEAPKRALAAAAI